MTTTTETCQQPCFCECCLAATVHRLMDDRAALLHAALADNLYADGFERQLADEIIAAIPVAQRLDVLAHALEWEHLMPRIMAVDCLLDETDARSYETLHQVAEIVLAAIRAQHAEGSALRTIVTSELCLREQLLRDLAQLVQASTGSTS